MRKLLLLLLLTSAFCCRAESTYIFFRHAEKQFNFSGQLSCQGLQRALHLPTVLLSRFGKPDYIYASAPIEDKDGSSVRALATVMPTAIQTAEKIILRYHAKDTEPLVSALRATGNGKTSFIAWEHSNLVSAVKELVLETGGDPSSIPSISLFDFDSLYVVKLNKEGRFKSFSYQNEGLNQLTASCDFSQSR